MAEKQFRGNCRNFFIYLYFFKVSISRLAFYISIILYVSRIDTITIVLYLFVLKLNVYYWNNRMTKYFGARKYSKILKMVVFWLFSAYFISSLCVQTLIQKYTFYRRKKAKEQKILFFSLNQASFKIVSIERD